MSTTLNSVAFALIVAFGVGCGNTVSSVGGVPGIGYEELTTLEGVTFCWNDKPHSFIDARLQGIDQVDVRVHEGMHRLQILRAGSCKAWNEYASNPRNSLELELEAYKAGWCASIHPGIMTTLASDGTREVVTITRPKDSLALRDDYKRRVLSRAPLLKEATVLHIFDSIPCPRIVYAQGP